MSNTMSDPGTTNPNGLPIVNRPCPEWCELPTGHDWDSEELRGLIEVRGHVRELLGDGIATQDELQQIPSGIVAAQCAKTAWESFTEDHRDD